MVNKIFIINNKYFDEFILDFTKNLILDTYSFDLIDKNHIKIKWDNEEEEILYTEDSYLYFLDKSRIEYIKKIFLFHDEWADQAIINLETEKIIRIGSKDERGWIKMDNNKCEMSIKWKKWEEEKFYKRDEYSYYKESYLNELNEKKSLNYKKNYVFIHICCIENWKEIYEDIINNIKTSGLYNHCEKIYLCIVGEIKDYFYIDKKINILYNDNNSEHYEIKTINMIKKICSLTHNDINILYLHTKGVRKAGNNDCTISWRKMMEYFLIDKWKDCLEHLNYYDTLGSNCINTFDKDDIMVSVNGNHNYHYSGNFWWSKKSHIDKLAYLPEDLSDKSIYTRCRAENWILSKYPDMNAGILFQDITNIHPYHRYVFDYYKKLDFIVKKIIF